MSKLLKRFVVAFVLLGIVLLLLFLSTFSQIFFDIFLYALALIAMLEIYGATVRAGYKPPKVAIITAAVLTYPLSFLMDTRGVLFALAIAFAVGFIDFVFSRKMTFTDFTVSIFVIIYPFLFFGLAFSLNNAFGLMPLLVALFAAVGTDIFAFFVGSAFGSRGIKVFPSISPKKTLQGFIGGLAGGVLGALFAYGVFEKLGFPANVRMRFSEAFANPILVVSLIGLIVAPIAEIGDLAASRVKRELGIKDYGHLLGEHGGVMDRLDSILFSLFLMAVFMYFVYPAVA